MFFYEYLKNPKQIGAFCSSSQKLGFVMTQNINLRQANYIVEIGPGTGVFTENILKYKNKKAQFFAIEINKNMAEKLKRKIANLDIEIGSAENLPYFLRQRSIANADVIVSGIPWSLLKDHEQEKLLKIIHKSLKPNGYFSTFAYILPTFSSLKFRQKIFSFFSEVRISRVVWQNFPPAVVYYCKK
ncbi:TPA: methyltransferase domain-containing protein [Campylobacter coli]|nr:methyltransferase domain-containing protein [Campylobacter coli]